MNPTHVCLGVDQCPECAVSYDDMVMERSCSTCGGDGYTECEDVSSSEGCWTHDNCTGFGFCPNCRGSGLAKDQRYW